MRNDSLNAIDLDQLATVTGGAQLPGLKPFPRFANTTGTIRAYGLANGGLRVENLARSAKPRSFVLNPVYHIQ